MQVLTDDDLDLLDPREAVGWMRDALVLHHRGKLTSPHRVYAPLETGGMTFTVGAGPHWYGYRAYDTLPTTAAQQVVVCHDRHTPGDVAAIHVGNRLGAIRTAALGASAETGARTAPLALGTAIRSLQAELGTPPPDLTGSRSRCPYRTHRATAQPMRRLVADQLKKIDVELALVACRHGFGGSGRRRS